MSVTYRTDVNGVELKIGDTVEVVDETGSYRVFRNTKGQLGTVVAFPRQESDLVSVRLQSGTEGIMYSFRFKKVENKVSRIGKKYKFRKTTTVHTYTVVYENEYGVLVTWAGDNHAWITNHQLKDYVEVLPEEWVILYKNENRVWVSESKFSTEQDAISYGKTFGGTMIQVVRLQK